MGYIDGIHGTPYMAAPWILWVQVFIAVPATDRGESPRKIKNRGMANQSNQQSAIGQVTVGGEVSHTDPLFCELDLHPDGHGSKLVFNNNNNNTNNNNNNNNNNIYIYINMYN